MRQGRGTRMAGLALFNLTRRHHLLRLVDTRFLDGGETGSPSPPAGQHR